MALMIVGFGIKDSISAIAVLQYEEIQQYDGNIILNEDASAEERDQVMEVLEKEEQVAAASEGLLVQITIGNGEQWEEVYLNVPSDVDDFSDHGVKPPCFYALSIVRSSLQVCGFDHEMEGFGWKFLPLRCFGAFRPKSAAR